MSSEATINALRDARDEIRTLKRIVAGLIGASVIGMYLAHRVPASVTLHVAPNLRAGDQIEVKSGRIEVPPPNVYAFAIYIWQQVNRWPKGGDKDYEAQIHAFQHYLTPSCQEQLRADRDHRAKAGELTQRTRALSEIPGFAYTSSRVIPDGPDAWTVLLDMNVHETARGIPVKDAYVRYPVRVVSYDVDREKNPFQLAVDCFGGNRPERIDPATVGPANSTATQPARPASSTDFVAPAVLPPDPAQRTRSRP